MVKNSKEVGKKRKICQGKNLFKVWDSIEIERNLKKVKKIFFVFLKNSRRICETKRKQKKGNERKRKEKKKPWNFRQNRIFLVTFYFCVFTNFF